jgi:hypothetical protein
VRDVKNWGFFEPLLQLINLWFDIPLRWSGSGTHPYSSTLISGCGDILFGTNCVRQWRRCARLCATAAASSALVRYHCFASSAPASRVLCSRLKSVLACWPCQLALVHRSTGGVWWAEHVTDTAKMVFNFYSINCLVFHVRQGTISRSIRGIIGRIGKVGREGVTIVIIKLKLA